LRLHGHPLRSLVARQQPSSSLEAKTLHNYSSSQKGLRGEVGGGTCAVNCAALHRSAPCQGSHTPMFKAERYVKPPPLHRLTAPDAVSLPGPLKNAHSVTLACLWRSRDLPLCLTEASWLPTKVKNPSYGPSIGRGPQLCYRTGSSTVTRNRVRFSHISQEWAE
ncbi:hypothetical protein JOQ06_019095, partial [Pogonophryne albipinna]